MGSILNAFLRVSPIAAQVVPDTTLPVGERSQVTGNPNVQIDGGARRGGNLFHSFSQFSIPTDGSAYFNNAADVQNIFSRVTGGSISNIDGLIRANGTANLFLLNPNGILFGPNASLNIGGSFVATTANAIGFPNGEVFSSDATQPLPSQLLTVNPNAFFFSQLTPKPIVNQSTFNGTGLQVPVKQNLLLVGGSVQFDNGRIASPGSYVEVGSVGGVGTAGLSTTSEDWQLSIPNNVVRADVSLSNDSRINVLGGGGGGIAVTARNVSLSEESRFRVGIDAGLGFAGAQTGGIQIDTTETVTLFNGGSIRIEVLGGGTGNVGDMTITTGSLFLSGVSRLLAPMSGQGNVGSVNIHARDTVSLDSGSYILGAVQNTGNGNTGGITITTGALLLSGGAQLIFDVNGQGNVGNLNIHARDRVSVDGETSDGAYASTIFTQVNPGAFGQGGNVAITTGTLFLTNGGAINTANTGGTGDAGRVTIQARDSVQIRGTSPTLTDNRSGVFTSATPGAVGNGGDVRIETGSLSVSNQGRIITNAEGQGNAGSIQIQATGAVSFDSGDAITTLLSTGTGRGGDIEIEARSLLVRNGAQISASTSGNGNAGNITVSADTVGLSRGGQLLTTTSSNGHAGDITVKTPALQLNGVNSGLFAETTSAGDAGNLTIQPRDNGQSVRVNLQNGAQISASTSSSGRGGQLTIAAPDSITLTGDGSIITAGTGSIGAGGNLNLRAGRLNIQDQAEVTVSSSDTGMAGSLFVDANRIFLNNQGRIRADTSGGGGNINLRSPFILLRNGSNLTTNATGANIPGGNIGIDTRFLIAVPTEDSNISANSENFRGGNVRINAVSIFGIEPRLTPTPLSGITATGATTTLSGTIDVITTGIDPTSGLVALPTDLADASGLIAQGCPANQGNSFVITGRGGLPPTPEQRLDDDAQWSDRRKLIVTQQREYEREARLSRASADGSQESKVRSQELEGRTDIPTPTPYNPIVEATGWQATPTGEVLLIATTPNPTVQNTLSQPIACQRR
jgi:filamentous hemagglutinin family protein